MTDDEVDAAGEYFAHTSAEGFLNRFRNPAGLSDQAITAGRGGP